MTIGILGTGMVGQILATALFARGNQVMMGTRNVADTLAKPGNAGRGMASFSDWHQKNSGIQVGTFAEAAAFGEILINATSGMASLAALEAAGVDNLGDKVLIDISNPLDFSKGMPPTLSVVNDDSLGEVLQRQFPRVKVVKTLNTMTAALMVNPAAVPGRHNVFVSGNDVDAKATVKTFLTDQFGWTPDSIIDMGDITTARGTEQLLPIWIRLYGVLQTPMFNFAIVK
ncbi:Metalloreductase STEAP3 [Fibrisoma limi BUZ 3]|uniref:Metalloreductase STEAP3 n=1 Tax=Fibrisoma limi BUZ 3 TaxID=1185876 RepID=I2GHH7_9BACT|nr:NAD(P)-binding domain-containing protein [Fibrisoma limi]CCH53352.1 Metalloreductase STEAP3 [Fibrisoma limi BUZ 3]